MAKTITSTTLNLHNEVQLIGCGPGPVVLIAQDDTIGKVLDVWIETDKESLDVSTGPILARKFLVLRFKSDVPEGYIHRASTVSPQGDSYHLYEMEEVGPSTDDFNPTFRFRIYALVPDKVGTKLVARGEADINGIHNVLSHYDKMGHFERSRVVENALRAECSTRIELSTSEILYLDRVK